jgi:hypothetical protein
MISKSENGIKRSVLTGSSRRMGMPVGVTTSLKWLFFLRVSVTEYSLHIMSHKKSLNILSGK